MQEDRGNNYGKLDAGREGEGVWVDSISQAHSTFCGQTITSDDLKACNFIVVCGSFYWGLESFVLSVSVA